MPIDDLDGGYAEHFATSPSTLFTFAVLCGLAIVVALLVRRRRALVLATGVAAAAVGGLTLAPAAGWTTFTVTDDPYASIRQALRPHLEDLTAWTTADGPANVALFIPLGLTLALLLRRPGLAALGCIAVSVVVEAYQAATGTRVGSFADVLANGLGAVLGAGCAAMIILVRRTVPSLRSTGSGTRGIPVAVGGAARSDRR